VGEFILKGIKRPLVACNALGAICVWRTNARAYFLLDCELAIHVPCVDYFDASFALELPIGNLGKSVVRDITTFGPSTRPVAPHAAAYAMVVLLSAIVSSMAVTTMPAWTQTLKQWKCTGGPDVAWEEQITGCTDAIKSEKLGGKDLAVAFAIRGSAYRARGELKRAVNDYDQAVKLNPNDADVFFRRGVAHGMLGDTDRAIDDFDQAIKLAPDHVGALYSRSAPSKTMIKPSNLVRTTSWRSLIAATLT
jgi:tetratricopeptide (TPR) repeat protein